LLRHKREEPRSLCARLCVIGQSEWVARGSKRQGKQSNQASHYPELALQANGNDTIALSKRHRGCLPLPRGLRVCGGGGGGKQAAGGEAKQRFHALWLAFSRGRTEGEGVSDLFKKNTRGRKQMVEQKRNFFKSIFQLFDRITV
jgi:hypothetical protein